MKEKVHMYNNEININVCGKSTARYKRISSHRFTIYIIFQLNHLYMCVPST